MKRRRMLLGLVLASALVSSACSGGTDAVDQSAGGQYRYVGATQIGRAHV